MMKMQLKNFRKGNLTNKLNKECMYIGVLIVLSTIICIGRPLNLVDFSPSCFVEFFLWFCGSGILTLAAGLSSLLNLENSQIVEFLTIEYMQMIYIGLTALLTLFIVWIILSIMVQKRIKLDWVRVAITFLRCITIWGIFQFTCMVVAYCWYYSGFKIGNCKLSEEDCQKQSQNINTEQEK